MNDQNQNDTEPGETVTDRFDAGVAKVARESYHTPPETPRDDMWAVIQAARAADVVPIRRFRPQPWWAAVAAALVIGVVLGRGTLMGPDAATTVAEGSSEVPAAVDGATPDGTPDRAADAVPRSYRFAAARHLNRTETFLTMFRVDARSDQLNDADIGTWSKRLLTDTRLLLDSPAGDDPELRRLLNDLELVLAQIVQLRTSDPSEVEIIDEGLESSQLLFRLKAAQATSPGTVRL
jgi:hypothetical protein